MRSMLTRSLALSLGLMVSAATAQEGTWRPRPTTKPTGTSKAAGVLLGRPIAVAGPANPPAAPRAALGKPVAIHPSTPVTPAVQPVAFTRQADPLAPVVRGAAPEQIPHRPMPLGDTPPAGMHGWKRSDDVVATTPRPGAGPIVATPTHPGGPLPGPVLGAPDGPIAGPGSLFASGPDCGCGPSCATGGALPSGCWDGQCPHAPRLSVGFEYLLWWMKGDGTPPLVTSGNAGVDGARAGNLFQPSTQVLYGDRQLGRDGMSGARLTVDYFFSDDRLWGIQLGGFFLGENQDRFTAQSAGNPVLARPIIEQTPGFPGGEDKEIVAFPSVAAGSISVSRRSMLWGYDINLKRNIWCGPAWYVDCLFGYRQVALDESLTIQESIVSLNNAFGPIGTAFSIEDKFSASNRFYGGQLGLEAMWQAGAWSIGLKGKVGLGNTTQIVQINGTTTRQLPGQPAQAGTGGLLALPTNIGRYSRDMFGIIPEVGITLGYQVTNWMRLSAGYNFLYWNNVVRPGEQIDRQVNRTFQPFSPVAPNGPQRPAFAFSGSEFFAHGLTLGMEFRY